ncbi:hypothetical protein TB1_034102 [Malus domestica]
MEDKKAQSVDDGGECESKNENNFSFTPTNVDGSPIFADDILQNDQIQLVFLILNQDLLFAEADDGDASRARAASSATLSSSLRPPLKKPFFIVVVGIRVGQAQRSPGRNVRRVVKEAGGGGAGAP